MRDQMEQDHRRDMIRDSRLRELRNELEWLYEDLGTSQKAFTVSDAIDVVDDERQRIVTRWN